MGAKYYPKPWGFVCLCLYWRRKRNSLEGGRYGGCALYPACCMADVEVGGGHPSLRRLHGKRALRESPTENRCRGSEGLVTLALCHGCLRWRSQGMTSPPFTLRTPPSHLQAYQPAWQVTHRLSSLSLSSRVSLLLSQACPHLLLLVL